VEIAENEKKIFSENDVVVSHSGAAHLGSICTHLPTSLDTCSNMKDLEKLFLASRYSHSGQQRGH
jgi:hypothetical protein